MKNIRFWALALVAAFMTVGCDEFPPVSYDDPDDSYVYTDADFPGITFTTIAELKAMYSNSPVDIGSGVYLKVQVTSSDKEGNLYRTMYIQDETGGMELKMGTRYLYNEYKQGQWLYIDCQHLTIGAYGGMIQLGYKSADSSYETAYIDIQYIVDTHIFKGKPDSVSPQVITSSQITDTDYIGRYVTVEGLTYGNQIFAILYDDNDNSTYLSSGTYGVTTWAINEIGFARYMEKDRFGGAISEANVGNYSASSYSVSQYFNVDGVDLQVRTSGYAKFADTEIDEEILNGATVSLTGILTKYNTNNQFLLNDLDGVVY